MTAWVQCEFRSSFPVIRTKPFLFTFIHMHSKLRTFPWIVNFLIFMNLIVLIVKEALESNYFTL
jgi:hypothetical protein